MTFTFTVLLCVGLTLGIGVPVLAGSLPKPILRVQPDSAVSENTTVTILCKGTMGAEEYRLYKEVDQRLQLTEIPQNPKNQAEFSISEVHRRHTGRYCCRYWTYDRWSEYSNSLEFVVTGVYSKPSLSALPSPVVTEGGNVTLQCASSQQYHRLLLTNKGSQKQSFTKDPQYNYFTGQFRAQFSVGPVTSSQRWTFMCYSYHSYSPQVWSEPSDPLELLVSGTLHKPTIKAEPGSVVASGILMTIWCQGTLDAEIYVLQKEGSQKPLDMQTPEKPENKTKFPIPSVTHLHAGKYHCYCYSSAGWTERSDTLELVVTGIFNSKPRLSALPSPVVISGGNMTLQCVSGKRYDKFILTKEDQKFLSFVDSQYIPHIMQYQALFSIDHVTPNLTGTFRCYGYYKQSPQLWSVSSDPLEICISGTIGTSTPPPSRPLTTDGSIGTSTPPPSRPMTTDEPIGALTPLPSRPMTTGGLALIVVSVAPLLVLIILICLLLRRRYQRRFRKKAQEETELQLPAGTSVLTTRDGGPQKRSNPAAATQEKSLYASVEDMKPKDGVELDSSRPPEEDPLGETYAQVKPSRHRRAEAVLPSVLSREVLERKDGNKTEEGREMDTQIADSEEPQDVVYAQLCSRSLRQGTAVPPRSQAGEATEEPSVYAALAVTRPGSVPDNKEQ
ncbi:leukocyte immunoglobulin-like receptor subfamily B member 3-like isoform X2 [Microtus pennsylvanicus]|uniref:leukocyte immunoglobulin-like receptor subfamily B member 3-like isoform X2 n=1 Tax=Microtus pennsylvanicus TaxID=10058 RepID=UPI003F6CE8E0